MDHHYYTRYNLYEERKKYEINKLENDLKLLLSKSKFIDYVINEKIIIHKKSKDSIIQSLISFEFPFYENDIISDCNKDTKIKNQYNYLLNLPVWNFTHEKIEELTNSINSKEKELNEIKDLSIKDLWIKELDILTEKYKKYYKNNK